MMGKARQRFREANAICGALVELLPNTSPLSWEHISLSGDFLWERAAARAAGRRSLNLASRRAVA
jgi:hypothetical protein